MKLTGVCLVLGAALVSIASGLAATSRTPAQYVAASIAAAKQQKSVHYVTNDTNRNVHITFDADATRDEGIQRVTYSRGGRTGHITVTMIGRQAFIRGDEFALANFMLFSAKLATQTAGSWISVPTTSKVYADVAADVELPSTVSDLMPAGTLTRLAPSTRGGSPVVGIRGRATKAGKTRVETLYVRASGTPLPVAEVAMQGSNSSTVTYSRWNETLRLATPVPKFVLSG